MFCSTLNEEVSHQTVYGKVASEYHRRPVKIVLSTGYDLPARIQVHGGTVVDYVWERQYAEGCRFTILSVYQDGQEVPKNQWDLVLKGENLDVYKDGPRYEDYLT